MSARSLLFVPGLILACCVMGCGQSVEELAPVEGKVLIDGKPLDGIAVSFIPEITKGTSNRRGGTGTTDVSGRFEVTDISQNKPGLPPGKYTVAYSRMRKADGSEAPEPGDGTPANPGDIAAETLPPHLLSPDPKLPENQVEVPADGNTKIELKISTK